jgi:hypothetical protein
MNSPGPDPNEPHVPAYWYVGAATEAAAAASAAAVKITKLLFIVLSPLQSMDVLFLLHR